MMKATSYLLTFSTVKRLDYLRLTFPDLKLLSNAFDLFASKIHENFSSLLFLFYSLYSLYSELMFYSLIVLMPLFAAVGTLLFGSKLGVKGTTLLTLSSLGISTLLTYFYF